MSNNTLIEAKHDREGLSTEKVGHFFRVLSGHTRKADAYLDEFSHFDVDALRALTKKRINHILVDIDACIAPAYGPILPKNLEHLERLLTQGLEIGIYSNCKGSERPRPLHEMGIGSYEGRYPKPQRQGFLEACDTFKFDPASTWMIGENPNTDGGAIGVLEGMAFVKPVSENPRKLSFKKRVVLPFQKALREIAIQATVLGNSGMIRSGDLQK